MIKHRITKWFSALLLTTTLLSLTACDQDTGNFGLSVMPEADEPTVSQDIHEAYTRSVQVDSIIANTPYCYLGRVTDPEMGTTTTCNYLAQFYILSDYKLPDYELMDKDADGKVFADSVEIRAYVNSFYGDSLNSMKIGVYELDKTNPMKENIPYYTNIDAEQFLSKAPDALHKELTFAVADLSLSDSIRYSTSVSKCICVKLPKEFGTKILRTYYEHPEYFKNSYNFIRNVVAGFYFKVLSGNGTLVNIDLTALSVYFTYTSDDERVAGVQRVAATEEVLQNNQVINTGTDDIIAQATDYTMIKTPAAIFTEVELPIDSVFDGHERDSLNSARIVFKRLNNSELHTYAISAPSQLLMLRKSELGTFFANHETPDSETSYITSLNASYNSYTFSNIGYLLTYLRTWRDTQAGITAADNEAARKSKLQRWEAQNEDKDWNKVLLIPVTTQVNQQGSISSISNDYSLTSTKLQGGPDNPLKVSVVYSKFK